MSDIIARDGIRAFLLQVLQAETGIVLNANEVSFSELTLVDASVTTYDDPDKRNTHVRIKKEASGGNPEVSVLLRYNRLSLSKLFTFRSATLTLNPSFTSVHDYLPALNTRLGTALTAEDVENGTLSGAAQSFTLRAPESSFYAYGSLSVSLVEEQTPEPEEEDEMYYTLIPPDFNNYFDESAKKVTGYIGSNCGYPTYLKSSDPRVMTVELLRDKVDFSSLVLESAKLYSYDGVTPDLTTNLRSGYNYSGGDYFPYSSVDVAPGAEFTLKEVGTFQLDTNSSGSDRLYLETVGDSWLDEYTLNAGRLLLWRAVFSHPSITDPSGKPALIYWNAVQPLTVTPVDGDGEVPQA